MIVPDINLLLYAYRSSAPEHRQARAWWEKVVSNGEVGLPLPVLFGFIRLTTNRRIFDDPLPLESAIGVAESWLERPAVRPLLPGPRHIEIAFRLLREIGTASDLTNDVQLAALAIENQAELCSNDTDFARFRGLRWSNPLEE